MEVSFEKYQGTGNDFIIVAAEELPSAVRDDLPGFARLVCDRTGSIGADGVLAVLREGGRHRMRIFNADGSEAEACLNGIRCVARYLVATGRETGETFPVAMMKGDAVVTVGQGNEAPVSLDLTTISLDPADLPVKADGPLVDAPFAIGGQTFSVTALSMGNPHVVIFTDRPLDFASIGRRFETDPRFPRGTNTNFVRVDGRRSIRVDTHERGVGMTLSCGSGVCASSVAGVLTRRLDAGEEIAVEVPGGRLAARVTLAQGRPVRVRLAGPAIREFSASTTVERHENGFRHPRGP